MVLSSSSLIFLSAQICHWISVVNFISVVFFISRIHSRDSVSLLILSFRFYIIFLTFFLSPFSSLSIFKNTVLRS
jgi:hypothetical protein